MNLQSLIRYTACVSLVIMSAWMTLTGIAPLWFVLFGLLGAVWVWHAFAPRYILKLGGKKWLEKDFCRGWLITGTTGCGKTVSGINAMLWQLTKNCPNWGGVCIDEKGVFWETLSKLFKECGREQDLVLLKVPDSLDQPPPKHTLNFLGIEGLTFQMHAKIIADTAKSLGQASKGDGFFSTQAQLQMTQGLLALSMCMRKPLSFQSLYEIFASEDELRDVINDLEADDTGPARAVVRHFNENFFTQPHEQRGGVVSTILNYLAPFSNDCLARVFCADTRAPTNFSFGDIDKGKVLCLSVPQKFASERRYPNTILKFCYYAHALRRFDLSAAERKQKNLLVLWADEAQKVLTANDDGLSDYNIVDVIRESRATVVAATQSYTSLIPPLGKDKANVFVANMANRINFKAADEESAVAVANSIGKRRVLRKNLAPAEEYLIAPSVLRNLKQFHAVVQHCEKGFSKCRLRPRWW